MKNKRMYITRLVYSILTTGFLIYFFSKTTNGRIIFIPFLICGFSQVIKNIVLGDGVAGIVYRDKIELVNL